MGMVTSFSHPSIWKERFQFDECPWRFCILACGGASNWTSSLQEEGFPLCLPSFHIFGNLDPIKFDSWKLEKLWDPAQKKSYTHKKGHEIDMQMINREPELAHQVKEFIHSHKQ